MARGYDTHPCYIELRAAFARRLKRICAEQGWTPARLAREMGTSHQVVYRLWHEKHIAWPVTILKLRALEDRLGEGTGERVSRLPSVEGGSGSGERV